VLKGRGLIMGLRVTICAQGRGLIMGLRVMAEKRGYVLKGGGMNRGRFALGKNRLWGL
jgi:hypothetical protein